eukprot:6208620-Pleurochrysis_carterae.AAC.1
MLCTSRARPASTVSFEHGGGHESPFLRSHVVRLGQQHSAANKVCATLSPEKYASTPIWIARSEGRCLASFISRQSAPQERRRRTQQRVCCRQTGRQHQGGCQAHCNLLLHAPLGLLVLEGTLPLFLDPPDPASAASAAASNTPCRSAPLVAAVMLCHRRALELHAVHRIIVNSRHILLPRSDLTSIWQRACDRYVDTMVLHIVKKITPTDSVNKVVGDMLRLMDMVMVLVLVFMGPWMAVIVRILPKKLRVVRGAGTLRLLIIGIGSL